MKKKLRIILILSIAILMIFALVACSSASQTDEEGDDDTVITTPTSSYSVSQAMNYTYDGLLAARDALASTKTYAIESEYTIYTKALNYTICYKANYAENPQDSEIYLSVFDNEEYKNRISCYYDKENLYLLSDDQNKYIENFSSMAMFDSFYELVQYADMSSRVFSETGAYLFDKDDASLNIGLVIDVNNINRVIVSDTRDSLEYNDISLDIISDTLNTYMDNYFGEIGDKFDVLTDEYLDFSLSKAVESRFAYIQVNEMNFQREDGVIDYVNLDISGSFRDASEYIIKGEIRYDTESSIEIEESSSYDATKFENINLGQSNYEGTVSIPSLFDIYNIYLTTNLNSNTNEDNEISFVMEDSLGNENLGVYYRDQVLYVDETNLDDLCFADAVDTSALNLPKVYFENINICNLINALTTSGLKMVTTILNGNMGEYTSADESLYEMIMANFGSEGNVIYYTFTEDLIQSVTQDDTRMAELVAEALGVDVEKLDSIIGEDFFEISSIKLTYDLDTGTIGVSYYYDEELVFEAELDEVDYNGVSFPIDTIPESYAYEKLLLPDDIKTEVNATLSVGQGIQESDISTLLGAFMGDPSGENTPYILSSGYLVLEAQVSESFVTFGSSEMVSEYKLRFDLYYQEEADSDEKTLLMSVYTNPQNSSELLVNYLLPFGKDPYANTDGVKYKIQKSVVGDALNELLGEDNIFNDTSVIGLVNDVLNDDSIQSDVTKEDGYYHIALTATTDESTNTTTDPIQSLIGVSDLQAEIDARFLFEEVLLNDIDPSEYNYPTIDLSSFDGNVQISSLYSPDSIWKDSIDVYFDQITVSMVPNYVAESITIGGDKSFYEPTSLLFGQSATYTLTITTEMGTYTVLRLVDDIIKIDPAYTDELPSVIEVEFTNGSVGELSCSFEGITDNVVTLEGLNLDVFANEETKTYTLNIGGNSIMEASFTVYIAVYNRTVVPLTEDDSEISDSANVPVVGIISVDPYSYAIKKLNDESYNPITEGIISQEMKLNFYNVYGINDENLEELTFDAEGSNFFYLSKLDLDWEFDETKIKYNGGQLYAYAYYGSGSTAVEIAIRVDVKAKVVDYVQINDEEVNKYTIDSLITSTYVIPTQTGVDADVWVYFGDGTYRIVEINRPEDITDDEYYANYLPTELQWYIPNADYMSNVTLEYGASALFGDVMGNSTYATISIGTLGSDTVSLYVEVPERRESTSDLESANAVKSITDNGDGTFTLSEITSVQLSPIAFEDDEDSLYGYYSINPYDEDGKLPNNIYMKVYTKYSNKNATEIKEYEVSWLTTAGVDGAETNILYIDDDGYARLAHPTTDENYFYIYGVVGDGSFSITIKARVRNMESQLQSIEYDGLSENEVTMIIDPYKSYILPGGFTATLESGEDVIRSNISWMVQKDGDDEFLPITEPTSGTYDETLYDSDGKYIFSYEGGDYLLRYILSASGSVLSQALYINVEVEARTIVSDTVNIYETGSLVAGYTEINYYKEESMTIYNRIEALINDSSLNVGVGFEEARTDLILDRYNLNVDWLRASESDELYTNSLDYLEYILKNPSGGETMELQGTIYTGTVNEQSLSITFSLASLIISNITIVNAEYSESEDVVELPQKASDGRISMDTITTDNELVISIPKIFALTVPVDNIEVYASPYEYINYIFEKIIMVYYNGSSDSDIVPVLDFGDYTEKTFNQKVLGITDGLYSATDVTTTYITIKKLSAGSAEENIIVRIEANVDIRESTGKYITAELYNENGESCDVNGYALPLYIDVPYTNSGTVRYYLDSDGWLIGDNYITYFDGAITAKIIDLQLINVLCSDAVSYGFYYILPLQGLKEGSQDEGYYYLTVNIPRKNINNTNYTATADDSMYDITDGYISISNAYLFYNNETTYTTGSNTYKTGYDYSLLPSTIYAKIITDYFDSTSCNYFNISWIPKENAITQEDIENGISIEDKRILATATILSYYNDEGEHVTQTITVYVEMEAMEFSGIEYEENGCSLDIREDETTLLENYIVIDPYDEPIGYNGLFVLPTVGLVINFENNESYTVTPNASSTDDNPTTDAIEKFILLDNDGEEIRSITSIPYSYSGYTLSDSNLPLDGYLYVKMEMFTGQEIILKINILSRVIDEANIINVVTNDSVISEVELPQLYYIDPYNSITHQLPTTASIFFQNNDNFVTLDITRWEIYQDGSYVDIDECEYFYTQNSTVDTSYEYAYYSNGSDGYKGGAYNVKAYISMGTNDSGTNIGEQGFEILIIVLNRSLKETYYTSYEYSDPIAGLLEDIGGDLSESMFVAYDNYYAELFVENGISSDYYYSAISDGAVTTQIDWSRYVDDSIISYDGFNDKEVDGYLYYENTNIDYLYDLYSSEVDAIYAELIKAMTWDAFFTTVNGELEPLNYYSTTTASNLTLLAEELEVQVKNATYEQLLETLNSSEDTVYLATRLENTLLRSIMSSNSELESDSEGIAYLYDYLIEEYENDDIKDDDRTIYLNWLSLYNSFTGNYAGYVENIDAENLTDYQILKRDMYDRAYDNLYFYGDEYSYNDSLYSENENKLYNYINSAIYLKIYNMSSADERLRMSEILGNSSSASARSSALNTYLCENLTSLGSYGEYAYATISAPAVTFDKIVDSLGDELDTFYFNIYTYLSLDTEVQVQFVYSKEDIYQDLIDEVLDSVIESYREGVISSSLEDYLDILKAEIVNSFVPTDSDGDRITFYLNETTYTYEYANDVEYSDDEKNAAITAYRNYVREIAISHIDSEDSAETTWNSLYGAYYILSNTDKMEKMDEIYADSTSYDDALATFEGYLQDCASEEYDTYIAEADKILNSGAVDSIMNNPSTATGNGLVSSYQVFMVVYGDIIGTSSTTSTTSTQIYSLVYNSLDTSSQTTMTNRTSSYTGTYTNMQAIYYYLYDSGADATIKRMTQDIFYMMTGLSTGYDILIERIDELSGFETLETMQAYLDNLEIEKSDYADILTDSQFLELKKARVFRQIQTYYSDVNNGPKTVINDVFDEIYLDIKSDAYNDLYTGLLSSYTDGMKDIRAAQGDAYAIAFDNIVEDYEDDADEQIDVYYSQIEEYIDNNFYKYAEDIYETMYANNSFDYYTSVSDSTIINYLDLTESEIETVECNAVNYYVENIATEEEKTQIMAASSIFGEYWISGNYSAPVGIYEYLLLKYDMGSTFIEDIEDCYYYCVLEYCEEKESDVISAVIGDSSNATTMESDDIYIGYYDEYYEKLIKMSSYDGNTFSEDLQTIANNLALADYINYEINQVVLYDYECAKDSIMNGDLTQLGEKEVYYDIYETESEDLDEILENKYAELATDSQTRYYDAYNVLKEQLITNAMSIIDEVTEEVQIREGYITVFDSLEMETWSTTESYTSANLSNFRTLWEEAVENNTSKFYSLLGSSIYDINVSVTKTLELGEALYNISDYGSIATVAAQLNSAFILLANKYDSYYNNANDIEKGFIEAIYRQEEINYGKVISDSDIPYLKIKSYVTLCDLINYSSSTIAFSLDEDLVELADIENNERTVFNDYAKEEYLNLFIEYLYNQNYSIAAAYLENAIIENYFTTTFVVKDSFEGMTDEEYELYEEELADYTIYINKIYDRLLLTSMNSTATSFSGYIDTGKFLTSINDYYTDLISLQLSDSYLVDVSGTSDSTYSTVFDNMVGESIVEYTFYSQDHISSDAEASDIENRHLIYFDVQVLEAEENSSTQDINKLYLTNLSKENNSSTLIGKDGFRFIYPQIEILYVDYYNVTDINDATTKYNGGTTTNSKYINKITIDALNPDLPDEVQAYGVYLNSDSDYEIIDVGMVSITYDSIFLTLDDVYAGNAENGDSTSSYQITAVNERGGTFQIALTVFYLDRTVESYYITNSSYTSTSNIVGGSGDYSKYYNLLDDTDGCSKITIDPTLEDLIDITNNTYKLPSIIIANYQSYDSDTYRSMSEDCIYYYDVEWDLSEISYSLSGLSETSLRILCYYTSNGDGTYNKVEFDYDNDQVTITKYSDSENLEISQEIFTGTPSYDIWNITLEVSTKTVEKLYIKQDDGTSVLFAEFVSLDISGTDNDERWLVAESDYTVNPYYVEFFDNIILEFSDGDTFEMEEGIEWEYNSANGESKLQEIVNGSISEANNRYIVAGFSYISETIWVKLMVDDIEIERPSVDDGQGNMVEGYIDGGTIYLLAQTDDYTVSKDEQLATFYPYLYYNFSTSKYYTDWRKVPLTFSSNTIRNIVLNEGNEYTDVLAILGNNSSDSNISFTVKVINPSLYAELDEDNNEFVTYDILSMPVDGNSRVVSSSSDMPQIIGNYFIELEDGEETLFYILNTTYDVVSETVTYECRYYMDEASDSIAGTEDGSQIITFMVVIPLSTYTYTNINDINFVESDGVNYSWDYVNEFDQVDTIYWELGVEMKPSLLPQGYDIITGEVIDFLWDLDDININLATGLTKYYTIKAYYYVSTAQWLYKEVNVYILRSDISDTMMPSLELEKTYDGNEYTYTIDYTDLAKLRSDGTIVTLDEDDFTIEYRLQDSSEYNYSTTYSPLNAGVYYIRVTLEDYNFYGVAIITFTINAYEINGSPSSGMGSDSGIVTDIVFEGADDNNYIYYTYNEEEQGLVVESGLPYVHVGNWPQTKAEKEELYLDKLGDNPTDDEIIIAKCSAYYGLYEIVTPATQTYLTSYKAYVKEIYDIDSDNELCAKVFDLLDYDLYICEVIPTIIYKNTSDVVLEKEPVDVGTYIVTYNIESTENNGNYIFSEKTTTMVARIIIEQQEISYSLTSSSMTYNGSYQDPVINNLHLSNGNLPVGVTVTYTYSYISNLTKITTSKVKNVGTYSLTIEIDGGNNYPSDTLDNLTVSIIPQDVLITIDEEATRSQYLDSIVDYGDEIIFDGLVGTDKASNFYQVETYGEVEDYYTLGEYPIYITGFKIDSDDLYSYTTYDATTTYTIDGVGYYKLTLKTALENGSLYAQLDDSGNYIYSSLISKFTNYNVYIAISNIYTIYPDGEATIVTTDEELISAVASVTENSRATIYLSEGSYSKLTINVNASITLIGCYNEDREIISKLAGISIIEGEVKLEIINIEGVSGSDSIYIGDDAGMISILDCYLDGLNYTSSRAVVTSDGYTGLLYINDTTITRFTRAIELQGGSAEITSSIFKSNSFGIAIYTSQETYIRDCEFTSTSNNALTIESDNFIILDCYFSGNLVAVLGAEENETIIMEQNEFSSTNGTDYKIQIYI
jgi:hypothetical protein